MAELPPMTSKPTHQARHRRPLPFWKWPIFSVFGSGGRHETWRPPQDYALTSSISLQAVLLTNRFDQIFQAAALV
jgi:hypothetical protein